MPQRRPIDITMRAGLQRDRKGVRRGDPLGNQMVGAGTETLDNSATSRRPPIANPQVG